MKYLGVVFIAYLLCGVHCSFWDDLKSAASSVGDTLKHAASAVGDQVKHYGGQALQSALDTVTTDGVHQLVTAGLSAATTAALTALAAGKRETSNVDQAVTILKQDAATLEKILHSYSADLQTVYNNIENMEFLRHDPKKFLADIGVLKSHYEGVLDNLAKNFQAKMSQLQSHKKRGLLDGLAGAFQNTVDTFKQTFGGVAGTLQTNGDGLLSKVFGHLSTLSQNLGTSLSGLKGTAAQLLAQGQEHLQTLSQQTGTSLDQTHTGVAGAASQVVDTLLHPQN